MSIQEKIVAVLKELTIQSPPYLATKQIFLGDDQQKGTPVAITDSKPQNQIMRPKRLQPTPGLS